MAEVKEAKEVSRFFTLTGEDAKLWNSGVSEIGKAAHKMDGIKAGSDKAVAIAVSRLWQLRDKAGVTEERFVKQLRKDAEAKAPNGLSNVRPQLSKIFRLLQEGGPDAEKVTAQWAAGRYNGDEMGLQKLYKQEFPAVKGETRAPKLAAIVAGLMAGEYTMQAIQQAFRAAQQAAEQEAGEDVEEEEEAVAA